MSDKKQQTAYPLRMSSELREKVEAMAHQNKRSVNAEIVARLEESLSSVEQAIAPNEHEAALTVLGRMYSETVENIYELRARSTLSPMEQVELQHEEATAKYLRQAAARASLPVAERPTAKKRNSKPLGIDTKHHLAAMNAINTPLPKNEK